MKKFLQVALCVLYWLISLTWGALMTAIGLITALIILLFFKGKPHRNGFSFIIELGDNWGGISLGAVSFCGSYSESCPTYYEYVRRHEFGHSLQNLIFGPFMLFVIGLPSLIRSRKYYSFDPALPPYDSVWFEYTASLWGHKVVNKIEGTTVEWTINRF